MTREIPRPMGRAQPFMGYYGISWEMMDVNGFGLFRHGKSQ